MASCPRPQPWHLDPSFFQGPLGWDLPWAAYQPLPVPAHSLGRQERPRLRLFALQGGPPLRGAGEGATLSFQALLALLQE